MNEIHPKEVKMNFRKLHLILLATALGGAMGSAFAQQAGMGASASGPVAPTPAAVKTAIDVQGNAALTSETALSGTPRQGSPGTQSGVAVTHTTAMGASGAWSVSGPSPSFAGLSDAQLRSLERYSALR
jgi:hypothetical protein